MLDSSRSRSARSFGLDALRVLAALGVFLKHSSLATGKQLQSGWAWTNHFEVGPAIFFALSAYLVYSPFVRAHLDAASTPSRLRFAVHRVVRIVPAYWCALAVLIVVDRASQHGGVGMHFGGPVGIAELLTFTHIYDPRHFFDGIAAAYTLDVEVSFYVFVLVWVGVIRWIGRRTNPFGAEVAGLCGLAVVNLAWRVLVEFVARPDAVRCTGSTTHWTCAAVNWLPGFLDYFVLGMACALVVARRKSVGKRIDIVPRSAAAVAIGAAAAGLVLYSARFGTVGLDTLVSPRALFAAHELRFAIVALLLVPAVFALHAAQDPPAGRARRVVRRVVPWFAMVSYGFYLWHQACIDLAIRATGGRSFHARFSNVAPLALVGAIGIAAVSWYLLEAPLQRRRDRFVPEAVRSL